MQGGLFCPRYQVQCNQTPPKNNQIEKKLTKTKRKGKENKSTKQGIQIQIYIWGLGENRVQASLEQARVNSGEEKLP